MSHGHKSTVEFKGNFSFISISIFHFNFSFISISIFHFNPLAAQSKPYQRREAAFSVPNETIDKTIEKLLVHLEHDTATVESLFVTLTRLPSRFQQSPCRVENGRGAFRSFIDRFVWDTNSRLMSLAGLRLRVESELKGKKNLCP